jgi:uncharacterized membrane protein
MLIDQYLALPIRTFSPMFLIICVSCVRLRFYAAVFMQVIYLLMYLDFGISIVQIHLRSHHVRSFHFKTRDIARRAMLLYFSL